MTRHDDLETHLTTQNLPISQEWRRCILLAYSGYDSGCGSNYGFGSEFYLSLWLKCFENRLIGRYARCHDITTLIPGGAGDIHG